MISYVVVAVSGIALGSFIGFLLARSRTANAQVQLAVLQRELATVQSDLQHVRQEASAKTESNSQLQAQIAALNATLDHERRASAEKLAAVTQATDDLKNVFQALAADALKNNNQSFLSLATENLKKFQAQAQGDLDQRKQAVENLVAPIRSSLDKVDQQIQAVELSRQQAYGSITQQVRALIDSQQKLESETGNLVKALRAPQVRGRWGEMQLRRVVEIAGMTNYCDFEEQASVSTEDGRLRPDLIVHLPGGKNVIVDAKTPLAAYLEACEANDESARTAMLKRHADQVAAHMTALSSKAYWDQFQPTPEFVIMFLPGEMFYSAALEQNPALIENGVQQRVIPASPTTLIALLRAVAYGWKQETIAENAAKIADLGRELYDRLCKLAEHMEGVGKGLDRAIDCYNKAVGTMETRVFTTARKLPELGATAKQELPELSQVEKNSRQLQASDWQHSAEPANGNGTADLLSLAAAADKK